VPSGGLKVVAIDNEVVLIIIENKKFAVVTKVVVEMEDVRKEMALKSINDEGRHRYASMISIGVKKKALILKRRSMNLRKESMLNMEMQNI